MIKIGIVADNYKVDRFKKELDKKKYNYEVMPFTSETTQIHVNVEKQELKEVHKLCKLVEMHFKQSN